jgi:two-component system, sensor histidine kinase and response regulator
MLNDQKPLFLIIDDEESLRDGCKQTLEKSGYRVLTAAEGVEGIKLARENKPDVAFIDLKMPGIPGMTVVETLSKDTPDTVLIIITGYASIDSAVEAIQKGAFDYLPKPFGGDQLRAAARQGLIHRNLKIETRRLREEKERMEKSFITFVSHEMRSPLVVVRQYLEFLKVLADNRFDGELAQQVKRCCTRIQSLEELIEHWLDLSRIENGTFTQKREALILSGIVAKCFEELAPLCEKKAIALEVTVPENQPAIIGDEESLVRVFTNIICNAVQYTPTGGKISVSATDDECYIVVSISDTGIGIPQDKIPLIFEPFFRVKGRNESQRGSGLGLTFCKKIMESHGGSICVESKEGEGTTFVLKFPRSHCSSTETAPRALP